ncbi:MAG: hypothetical protein RLZZ522_2111 [Verrucomicrobiota bacterium]
MPPDGRVPIEGDEGRRPPVDGRPAGLVLAEGRERELPPEGREMPEPEYPPAGREAPEPE